MSEKASDSLASKEGALAYPKEGFRLSNGHVLNTKYTNLQSVLDDMLQVATEDDAALVLKSVTLSSLPKEKTGLTRLTNRLKSYFRGGSTDALQHISYMLDLYLNESIQFVLNRDFISTKEHPAQHAIWTELVRKAKERRVSNEGDRPALPSK